MPCGDSVAGSRQQQQKPKTDISRPASPLAARPLQPIKKRVRNAKRKWQQLARGV
jgi:hypothetical protein